MPPLVYPWAPRFAKRIRPGYSDGVTLRPDSSRLRRLIVAHSPASDDAFMFFALAAGKIDPRGFLFLHELHDIEALNLRAQEGLYEVTAISFHAYPYVRHHYRLITCGACVGDGYGPLLVSKRPITAQDLDEVTVAIPGQMTTAYLALKLLCPAVRTKTVPSEQILASVARGDADAGLVLREGQLTFPQMHLHRVIDLGEWWTRETGLPLPLVGVAIRRDIDRAIAGKICDVLRDSIGYALEHRAEALEHALSFARGMDRSLTDRFVHMYVKDYAVELGRRGEEAVALLFRLGHEAGIIPHRVEPEFVD
ncbi:MAG: ABC transporter substrate-binding protein [Planctomycetes bacterium]|nr:ABC transporter substrate-binding protein [Planctomycetota bacterium]